MRRELAIAAAVLVPFAALVAAGFWFTRPAAPDAPRPDFHVELTPPTPRSPEREPAHRPAAEDAGVARPADAGAASAPPVREDLRELLTTVAPRVRRCLQDEEPRGSYQVRVRLTQQGLRVESQNPYLTACVEDVFEEVGWHPPRGFEPAQHTFSFDGPKD